MTEVIVEHSLALPGSAKNHILATPEILHSRPFKNYYIMYRSSISTSSTIRLFQSCPILDHFRILTISTIPESSHSGPSKISLIWDHSRMFSFWTLPECSHSAKFKTFYILHHSIALTFWNIPEF